MPQGVSLGLHELFQEDPYIPDTLRLSPPFYSLYRKHSNFQTDEHVSCREKRAARTLVARNRADDGRGRPSLHACGFSLLHRDCYSTVTDLARLRGWSTSQPRRTA